MKILVISQYYYPEPFRITDICEELVKLGHDVLVVTGTPNYPMGEIYEGYEKRKKSDEVINGVKIHRCKIHPRKSGSIHRLWNYYSYCFASTKYIKKLDNSYDIVFINQLSPVMMAKAGIKYAKLHNKKSILYCLDLWPASLIAGGVSKGLIYKWFYHESKKIYKSVDKILITSKSFAKYFKEEFDIKDTYYLPQYAEDRFNFEECKKVPNEFIDLMFAGNIGTFQSVDTIIKSASLCKDIKNLRWHIVGDGIELDNCKKLANRLGVSINFYGRKSLDEMPKYYSMADAMLVTMKKDDILNMTLPGKVQSYMAAGKPILGAIDGETQFIVKEANCGYITDAEDVVGLEKIVRKFVKNINFKKFGQNSREYYNDNFSKKNFINSLIKYWSKDI